MGRAPRIEVRRDPHGAWEMAARAPAAPLRGLVQRYVGFVETSTKPLRRRETPTGAVHLILNLGAPLSVGAAGPRESGRPEALYRGSFVARVSALPAVTEFVGTSTGVEIELTPRGARMLLGLPMDEVPEPALSLEELLGAEAPLLAEELALLGDWEARLERVDRFVLERIALASEPAPSVEWAWRALRASGGRIEIGSLAERIGCSRRHLIAGFRDMVGVPPKTAAAIVRFERASRLLRGGGVGLAAVALDCGYHDQSHMSRDFRRLAGTTPAAYARAAFPDYLGTAEERLGGGSGDEVNSVQDAPPVAA